MRGVKKETWLVNKDEERHNKPENQDEDALGKIEQQQDLKTIGRLTKCVGNVHIAAPQICPFLKSR